MNKKVLITGCSSGLGLALTTFYLQEGFSVYGISKTNPKIENENFHFKDFDLGDLGTIKPNLLSFIGEISGFDIAYLNAGILGEIKELEKLELEEIKKVLDVNVLANKELLDILAKTNTKLIIGISSGASIKGSKGWGAYSLSKCALNMLINLYSKEMINTKLLAVAPGVIETKMTDVIRFEVDDKIFTSAKVLKEGCIQQPIEAAFRLNELVKRADEFESGSFIDVRNI